MSKRTVKPVVKLIPLTLENAIARNTSIINNDNPEWGTFGIMEKKDNYLEIHGRSGRTVLMNGEFKFWSVVSK